MVYDNPDGVMIGLEVHVQLNKLNTKMFCGCSTKYHDAEPNTHVCPVCLGLPGALPVINKKSVEAAMKIGLALNCEIVEQTQFHRKNYYYPDLPKGFQTTQYDFPIVGNGKIVIEGEDGEHVVRITRAHMEEDPGRLMHMGTIEKSKGTLIDYNRSGMSLIEIVSEPDMRSPKEARRYLDKLRNILEYLDVFDGSLEGSMRVDSNVSIMGGQRVEVKNISSHKGAERAILFEIMRQKNLLRRGGKVVMETRHFDEARGVTISMRTKEEEHDYRYFPEPDLVPMRVSDWGPAIKETLPELPDAKRDRFVEQYGITEMHAKALTSDIRVADFFEVVASKVDPRAAGTWVADVLRGELNYRDLAITSFATDDIVDIINLVLEEKITEKSAVDVIRTVLDEGGSPMDIVKEKGLLKVEGDIVTQAVSEAIAENDEAVQDYLGGTEKSLNFLVGQVMKKTKGRADARQARELLIAALKD
ncbi:Asp-tRNA(Asn)/Glu-tRNA(Gln) amidotransferase subunit GatB [Methanococcoides sp. LMO-2]|uniref:Aspartyl/glutamyl-tRNA(Asn/Gln) amidotransferase subunit B n=1 Tax=Methanococcoides cohabitans TaxID=3136559 RepID=A0ABU9KVB9_9EURY